jgi:YVTN family beta-propeller protein
MFSKRAAIAGAVMLSASMTIMDSCSSPSSTAERTASAQPTPNAAAPSANEAPLPGMPAVLDPRNIYAANRPGELSPAVAQFPTRIYVPNSGSNSVDVIDTVLFKSVEHLRVSRQPQNIMPS